MKKNQVLLIVFLALLGINAAVFLIDGDHSSSDQNHDLFAISDTSSIEKIVLNSQKDTSIFQRTASTWILNHQYKVDENLKTILLRALSSINIKRAVSKLDQEKIFQQCLTKGTEVKVIGSNDQMIQHFYAHGDPLHTKSYFADQNTKRVYVVEIPGYTNYISGLFTLIPTQWRDRMLFSTSWSSLLEISVKHVNNDLLSFSIVPGDNFPKLAGVTDYDTTAVMDYIQAFAYFQSNEIIPSGLFPKYDSLSLTKEDIVLTVKDFDDKSSNEVRIYAPLPNETIQLAVDSQNNMSVIEVKRLEKLLVSKERFLQTKKL